MIARTAHASLGLLQTLRIELDAEIPLAWSSELRDTMSIIEVYPAATIIARGFGKKNYHSEKSEPLKKSLIEYIQKELSMQKYLA